MLICGLVCINQADNQEKNWQVRSMGRIYALARKVRIWLGPATDEEMDAVFPMLSGHLSTHDNAREIIETRFRERSASDVALFHSLVEEFFSRAWFTRRWVLQEVALAREVIVHCGHRKVRWDQFYDGAVELLTIHFKGPSELDICVRSPVVKDTIGAIITLNRHWYQALDKNCTVSEGDMILDLLRRYHQANCVDEHDRLYALYGLARGTRLHDGEESDAILSCAVNYNTHFSNLYIDFAGAAVESGFFDQIIAHTLEFGGLSEQQESWPSWVPSWNMTRKMDCLRPIRHMRRSHVPSKIGAIHELKQYGTGRLWTEDNVGLSSVNGSKVLRLRGRMHCISDTQSSIAVPDAMAFFETMIRRPCVCWDSTSSRYKVVWLMTLALESVPELLSRPELHQRDFFLQRPSSHPSHVYRDDASWSATKRVLGLPSDEYSEEKFKFDEDRFLSETRRILQGLDAFCYEYEGSLTFGIAFAQVKPGDFVFRTTTAATGVETEDGLREPSLYGLLIRPYQHPSSTGPATFRLVGMCLDWFPTMEGSEIVEVALV
jgi:hypothetical protein